MTRVTVIGMDGRGPAPDGAAALAGATLVAGAPRHLAAVPLPRGARTIPLGDVEKALDELAGHPGPAVVLASGDPGFFGILRLLRERGLDPRVLPAVSTVAAAFAWAGRPWDDAVVVSAHGRDLRRAVHACQAHPAVAVLTGPGAGPAELGAALRGHDRRLLVAERLGHDDEAVTEVTPEVAAARGWREPNVVLSLAGAAPPRAWCWPPRQVPEGWALPVDAFSHRAGMISKPEVRAVALARLGPGLGDLLWDVGAGSGSLAVEAARFGAAVLAVERDPQACKLVERNASEHLVDVRVVQGSAPACLADLPDPDAAFVGGGGVPVVEAVAGRARRAVVVALAAVDRVAPVRAALSAAGFRRVDAALISSAAFADLPDGGVRLAPANPVAIVSGVR